MARNRRSDIPTDERLARVACGQQDLSLEALYFQFGRYLLIASSRPGTMAANLQGIWNDSLTPPWDSKYTININTEMNYWPAEVCNLSELHEPLFDLIENAREQTAGGSRRRCTARAASCCTTTPICGATRCRSTASAPASGRWARAWLSPAPAGSTTTSRATATFLRERGYPVMKEAAEFFLDYLVDDGKGHLVTGPSISPENRYRLPDGSDGTLCMGPTMDTEIAQALFTRLIEAAEILGVDADVPCSRVRHAARQTYCRFESASTASFRSGREDYDEPEPGHRHISHLFALHPGNADHARGRRRSWQRPPELRSSAGWRTAAATRAGAAPGSSTSGRGWRTATPRYENLLALLRKSTLPEPVRQSPAVPDRRQLRRHRRDRRDAPRKPRRRDRVSAGTAESMAEGECQRFEGPPCRRDHQPRMVRRTGNSCDRHRQNTRRTHLPSPPQSDDFTRALLPESRSESSRARRWRSRCDPLSLVLSSSPERRTLH